MTTDEYIQQRVEDQIGYYERRGKDNKNWHNRTQIIIIASGALIPLLIGYSEHWSWLKYFVAVLGAVIAICQGIYSLKKYAETWLLYRNTAEALKREKFFFLNKVGDYQDQDYDSKVFVLKCEQIMSGENANWIAVVGKKEETKPPKPNDNSSKPD